jgi:uncharacterized membrane protein (UPF0127 family)
VTPGVVLFNKGPRVSVDILTESGERERGLMGVAHLPDDRGAVFWMGSRGDHKFWGKGCLIAIDCVFVDFDHVVGFLTLLPGDESLRSLGRSSTTVLEVAGGWAARHGVRIGQKVQISLA